MSNTRVVEFYCGIGGLNFAFRRACVDAAVVAAFDIDRDGNRVYALNTGLVPIKADIGTLTAEFLDGLKATVWLLSPPCQPFTRQGLRRDSKDPRALSFLKLLQTLTQMQKGPECVLVENVVGFELSETRSTMLDAFERSGLTAVQECILSPDQFGIPYSRPRYFCLARTRPFPLQSIDILHEPSRMESVSRFPLTAFLEGSDEMAPFEVPTKFLEQCADVMNIVSKESPLLNCFTKSYGGRYFKGTGSFLATRRPEWIPVVCDLQSVCCAEVQAPDWRNCINRLTALRPRALKDSELHLLEQAEGPEKRTAGRRILFAMLKEMGIRYFTPREVAALHSFPLEFTFPADLSRKRQYALLGNSLSVAVVSALVRHLLE